jgi:hypothetical protein
VELTRQWRAAYLRTALHDNETMRDVPRMPAETGVATTSGWANPHWLVAVPSGRHLLVAMGTFPVVGTGGGRASLTRPTCPLERDERLLRLAGGSL